MMQSAYLRERNDFAIRWRFYFSRQRRIAFPRLMRSDFIVVAKIFSQHPPQVSFTKHNHMIQTFSPNTADQSFGVLGFVTLSALL